MEVSTLLNTTNNISNSIGIGGNYNASDPVVHLSNYEAEKRLKKIAKDYKETQSNWDSFYMKGRHTSYRSSQAGFCIGYYKDLREQLQNDLEKLNEAEETQRRTEKPNYCKEFLLHGCKSLAQEKRILHQIGEKQQQQQQQPPENNDLVLKDYWEIIKFSDYQSKIPKSSSSKGIHDLLRRFKDTEKLKDKATANGDNPTTRDSLKTSIKLLTKAVKKLEKELGQETMIGNGYEEMKRHLYKKCECIWKKWDKQENYIVQLKKIHKEGL